MKQVIYAIITLCIVTGVALAADKIIYFTAGPVPTTNEKAAIATMNAQAAAQYTVRVRNSLKARNRATVEAAAYYAGSVPPNYRDGGTDASQPFATIYDPANPPDPSTLVGTQTVLRSATATAIPGGGSITCTIASGNVTSCTYVAPDAGG